MSGNPSEIVASLGAWRLEGDVAPCITADFETALRRVAVPVYAVEDAGGVSAALGGVSCLGRHPETNARALYGVAMPCPLEHLGDAGFRRDYGLRYACLGGSMAHGICSVAMVEAFARAGMLAFFGAAGLTPDRVEAAVARLRDSLGDALPFGVNLIHSPYEAALEQALVERYLRRDIRLAEASAFLDLTLPLVRYRVHGIHRGPDGAVVAPNRVIAKISRVEVAEKFFSPPPEKFLRELVSRGEISVEQAEMAGTIPMAQDLTAEADSGGHTDKQSAIALFPAIAALRDRMLAKHGYAMPLRVGLGGGIATPASAAAAFVMGAAYVMTGTVNQACVESGTSDLVRRMLAAAGQGDMCMAPSAAMFELGVQVQVLKRGTMFPMRASKLYELYRGHDSWEAIPAADRERLEKTVFQASFEDVWKETRAYFEARDAHQAARADRESKYKMALVFRWYLGQSSHWAQQGDAARQVDFQVWCGPAMGAFNEWTRGSFLEAPERRRVVEVAMNILFGAAVMIRIAQLRAQGVPLPDSVTGLEPLALARIEEYLA